MGCVKSKEADKGSSNIEQKKPPKSKSEEKGNDKDKSAPHKSEKSELPSAKK